MLSFKIQVTQDDLNKAPYRSLTKGPIARSLNRNIPLLPGFTWVVGGDHKSISIVHDCKAFWQKHIPVVEWFLDSVWTDLAHTVHPFNFWVAFDEESNYRTFLSMELAPWLLK